MKKTFGKVLVALLVSVAFISLVGCNNNADSGGGGGDSAPPIALSTFEDLSVLGSYSGAAGSRTGTLSFNADKTGSYDSSNPNIRAASITSFTWSASKSGSDIKITIKHNGKTGTLTRDSNGDISGNLDDADKSNTGIAGLGYKAPTEADVRGTKWRLSWPSQGTMDAKLSQIQWYPIAISYASSGNTGVARVRAYGAPEDDYSGTWSIGTVAGQVGYIVLSGAQISQSLIKLSGNMAIVYDPNAGLLIYTKQ